MDDERRRREWVRDEALGSVRLEGGDVGPEMRADLEAYVRGELTLKRSPGENDRPPHARSVGAGAGLTVAGVDPYVDRNGVLLNRLLIRDADELARVEYETTAGKSAELAEGRRIRGGYDLEHLRSSTSSSSAASTGGPERSARSTSRRAGSPSPR